MSAPSRTLGALQQTPAARRARRVEQLLHHLSLVDAEARFRSSQGRLDLDRLADELEQLAAEARSVRTTAVVELGEEDA